ncbi:MAG: amidase [Pseudomonadota bacterium]
MTIYMGEYAMDRISRRAALKGAASASLFLPYACSQVPAKAAKALDWGAMDGVRTAEVIASGEATMLEAVEAAIARTEAVNSEINAIASETFEAARAAAQSTELVGDFAGVPTFIKDLVDWKGAPSFYGSRAFKGYVAQVDGPFAAAWRRAGIACLGKSTTPEAGLISSTEPLVTGATRNPWDKTRTPGGSSGGAAALTAAGATPFAHANDGGGSIRIPAAACGLFGFKPSRGRTPPSRPRATPPPVDISINHAVTWTVRDSAALLRAAEADNTLRPLGALAGASDRRLKIAFAPDPVTGAPLDPETRSVLQRTAELCESLGHDVVEASLDIDGDVFADRFLLYWARSAAGFADFAAGLRNQAVSDDIVEPWTIGLRNLFIERQADIGPAIEYLQTFDAQYQTWFDEFDVLLTPTVAGPPPKIGDQDPTRAFDVLMDSVTAWAAFTSPMNVAGAPSMSVPLGQTADGLPVASMFSARRGEDALLMALAYELEEAAPWINRRPPISAV